MKRMAAVVAGLLVPLVPAVLAPAPAEARTGRHCSYTVLDDTSVPGDAATYVISGGPILAADLAFPGEETAEIQLICTVQFGGLGGRTHGEPDAGSVASPPSPAVAVIPPTPVPILEPAQEYYNTFLCSAVRVNGVLRYRDAVAGTWSADPEVPCTEAISQTCCRPPFRIELDDVDGDGDDEVVVAFGAVPSETRDIDGDGDPDVVCECPGLLLIETRDVDGDGEDEVDLFLESLWFFQAERAFDVDRDGDTDVRCDCPAFLLWAATGDADGDGEDEVVVTVDHFFEVGSTETVDTDGDGDADVVCDCPPAGASVAADDVDGDGEDEVVVDHPYLIFGQDVDADGDGDPDVVVPGRL